MSIAPRVRGRAASPSNIDVDGIDLGDAELGSAFLDHLRLGARGRSRPARGMTTGSRRRTRRTGRSAGPARANRPARSSAAATAGVTSLADCAPVVATVPNARAAAARTPHPHLGRLWTPWSVLGTRGFDGRDSFAAGPNGMLVLSKLFVNPPTCQWESRSDMNGFSKRIGVIVPFDMALDREYWQLVPDDVSLHVTRLAIVELPYGPAHARAVADAGRSRGGLPHPGPHRTRGGGLRLHVGELRRRARRRGSHPRSHREPRVCRWR